MDTIHFHFKTSALQNFSQGFILRATLLKEKWIQTCIIFISNALPTHTFFLLSNYHVQACQKCQKLFFFFKLLLLSSERCHHFKNTHLFPKVCAYKRSEEFPGPHCTLHQSPWEEPWGTELIWLLPISTPIAVEVGILLIQIAQYDSWHWVCSAQPQLAKGQVTGARKSNNVSIFPSHNWKKRGKISQPCKLLTCQQSNRIAACSTNWL